MNIAYTFSGSETTPTLWSLTFIFGHPGSPWTYHHLHLSYHTKQTSVYFFGKGWAASSKDAGLIFTMDHLMPDVTASNAQQVLDKLLKLKAFS